MLGKVETPIFIMAACYIFIIGLILVLAGLVFISVFNINEFVEDQKIALVTRHCKVYFEQGQKQSYEGCVRKAIIYAEKEK
ncbi:MAG: hypothetical protein ABIF17_04455 [Patescibacteria group bacterium]